MAGYNRIPDLSDKTETLQSKGLLAKTKMSVKKSDKNNPYAPILDGVKQAQRIRKIRMEILEGKKHG